MYEQLTLFQPQPSPVRTIYGEGAGQTPAMPGRKDSAHMEAIYLDRLLPLEDYDKIIVLLSGGKDSLACVLDLLERGVPREKLELFLQKYQRRQIKQYQRREPIYKGMGDIICCLDESISTQGDPAAWGKAVALTLLEIAADSGRSFALIHFAGSGDFRTDVFRPGNYTMQDKLSAAETFLNGGTDFQTPMEEALRLVKEEGFENADVVFVTDGECALSQGYLEQLHQEQTAHLFTVTGVLLDKGSLNMDFSLKKFCQNIYRTS